MTMDPRHPDTSATPHRHRRETDPGRRLVAKLLDLAIYGLLARLLGTLGAAAGILYLAAGDALWSGMSVGKRVMDLKVVPQDSAAHIGLRHSVLRNLPVILVMVLPAIPLVGWLLFILLGMALSLAEVYLVLTDPQGHRLGDILGQTRVVSAEAVRHEDQLH